MPFSSLSKIIAGSERVLGTLETARAESKLVPTRRHIPINHSMCVSFYIVLSSKIVGESDKN